jgi:transcriptional regulator with GAF, ATPase, and Fis domain
MNKQSKKTELEFFRNVTLEICSSLNIEYVLHSCLTILAEKMPVFGMSVHQYQPETNNFHIMAIATLKETIEVDLKFNMPSSLKEFAHWPAETNLKIINDIKQDPVGKRLVTAAYPYFKKNNLQLLALRLDLKDKRRIADVCLYAEKDCKYSSDHARLFRMLNEPFAIAFSNFLTHRNLRLAKKRLDADNQYLRRELIHLTGSDIIGTSPGMKKLNNLVQHVAPMDASVLLTGETGVGKEIVANTIQQHSDRKDGPFIKINCGAIPESLIDSELFGHEKGAFTGADQQRKGRFELADGGTIFLDEIGEMPVSAQVRLLRVLQDGAFERVGGSQSIQVNIRVITATHQDIPELISKSKFRQDLYFRLNVFPIHIPPLRERKIDIPLLSDHFIRKTSDKMNMTPPVLKSGAVKKMQNYDWPGNVRELENLIERSLILHISGPLSLQFPEATPMILQDNTNKDPVDEISSLDDTIFNHIVMTLRASEGKIQGRGGAAEILKINPNTLRKKMQKLNIPYGRKIGKIYY